MIGKMGWAAMACAGLLGAALASMVIVAQARRLGLELTQGVGFADPACGNGYCDFSMFWAAGFLVRHGSGGALYDHARYAASVAKLLPFRAGLLPFVYPPFVLGPAAAISALPLVAGYYVFALASAAAAAWLLRCAGFAWWCIAVGFLGPAAMWNFYLGQFGLLCGALLVAGLSALARRPVAAGGLLGVLAIKPQYGVLVPVVVCARRHWRALAGIGMSVALLGTVSLLLGGPDIWAAYLGAGRAAARALLQAPFGPGYEVTGSSVFWFLRSLGAGLGGAYAGQGLVSAGAAWGVWRLWRRPCAERVTATVFLTLLATPYGFTDDLAVCGVLLAAMARPGAVWWNAGLGWLWVAPAFVPWFVHAFGFLPTPLLLAFGLGFALAANYWSLGAEGPKVSVTRSVTGKGPEGFRAQRVQGRLARAEAPKVPVTRDTDNLMRDKVGPNGISWDRPLK